MAAALGDLIQIVDEQRVLGEQALNIYYYRVTSITGFTDDGYAAIADWFEDTVIAAVVVEQTAITSHVNISIRNLTNGIDFYERSITINGQVTADEESSAPSYVSLGFKLIREDLTTRNGYKRIGGLSDTRLMGNDYDFDTGSQAAIEAALAADIVVGAVTLLEPVIVKRPMGNPPIASYMYSSIGDAQFTQLGTQNTRKRGRGA